MDNNIVFKNEPLSDDSLIFEDEEMPRPIVFRNDYDQQEILPQVEENLEQQMNVNDNGDHQLQVANRIDETEQNQAEQMMLLINIVDQRLGIECPICFVEFPIESVYATICGHLYCLHCIIRSYVNNGVCPLCNNRILDFDHDVHRLYL